MENQSIVIDTAYEAELEAAFTDFENANTQLVHNLLVEFCESWDDVLYLDDFEMVSLDKAQDAEHDHINQKEIFSGDAIVWLAVEKDGREVIQKHRVQYEAFAGKTTEGYHFDTVEVGVLFK